MSEPGLPTPLLDDPASMPRARRAYHVGVVTKYFETNRARVTEEALVEAARARGYPEDVVEEARARARANETSAPTRLRARRWIVAAYLLTFGALTIGMFINTQAAGYGTGVIGMAFLAMTLGLAFLLSLGWLRWRGAKVVDPTMGTVMLLSLPLVLLVVVAGICVASGLPIPGTF